MTIRMPEKTLNDIPKLHGLPVLGHLLDLRYDRLNLFQRISHDCGDIGAFHVGPQIFVFINSSDLIYAVLIENACDFERPVYMRGYARPVLGNGLLTSDNEFHKRQRKLIAPAFQHRRVSTYADTMTNYAEQFQYIWTEDQMIDLGYEMMRLTLWIIGKTLFDADVLNEAKELREALTITMRYGNSEFASLVHVPYSWPTLHNLRLHRAVKRLNDTIYRIITERRKSNEDCRDLLSMLLHARDADDGSFMTDAQVRDEAMTLFLAGHETTAIALTWALYLLTQHLDVYARMREEVDQVMNGRTPTFADLPELPYTLQVFKEAIRLYPPAYMSGRQAIRSVDVGGYLLPPKQSVLYSPYVLHRRSEYFPEPERFDPDRFTPEAEQFLPPCAYIPFGAGPTMCIGKHFALMEGHLILATLAQHVTFDLVPGQHVELDPLITLRPKKGIKMRVHRRKE